MLRLVDLVLTLVAPLLGFFILSTESRFVLEDELWRNDFDPDLECRISRILAPDSKY
jgi:hypothetical protein